MRLRPVCTGAQVRPKRKLLTLQNQRTAAKRPKTTPALPRLCGLVLRTAGEHNQRPGHTFLIYSIKKNKNTTLVSFSCRPPQSVRTCPLPPGSTSTPPSETGRSVSTPSNSKTPCSVWCTSQSHFSFSNYRKMLCSLHF